MPKPVDCGGCRFPTLSLLASRFRTPQQAMATKRQQAARSPWCQPRIQPVLDGIGLHPGRRESPSHPWEEQPMERQHGIPVGAA